jgi:hypothetical protein
MLWHVNAAFTIVVSDGIYKYTVTNLYAYASTAASTYGSPASDSEIEKSDGFNVKDFTMKNKNALNTHNTITKIIDDLNQNMTK